MRSKVQDNLSGKLRTTLIQDFISLTKIRVELDLIGVGSKFSFVIAKRIKLLMQVLIKTWKCLT